MGVIQNAINQALGVTGTMLRLSPGLEERRKNELLGKQLEKEEERLSGAITKIQEGTTPPKGIAQEDWAEYETETTNKLLEDLERVQTERLKRGEAGFEPILETKQIKSAYKGEMATRPQPLSYEDKIKNRINANKKAEEKFISQSKQRNEYNNIVKQLGGNK